MMQNRIRKNILTNEISVDNNAFKRGGFENKLNISISCIISIIFQQSLCKKLLFDTKKGYF